MKSLQLGTISAGPFTVPIDIVTEKLAFLGRTGSGKTYTATKLAELMLDAGAQVIALDPVGVWRGLRMGADFKIYIFGGQSGEFPLEPTGGALVAEIVVERGISAVLDVSQFETDADHRRFAYDFATRFFHLKKTKPSAVHLFIEEAQEFVPQDKQHGDERMLHAFQRLWKLGRNFGIGGSLITQRPQDVNKKALNMSGTLFVHQMTAPGDRDVISNWVDEKGIAADVGSLLPKLALGAPHVWSPDFLKVSERVHVYTKRSADISSTPKVGASAKPHVLSSIDTKRISQDMAATIERAKENDPAEMKREIARLRGEVAKKPTVEQAPPVSILTEEHDRRLHEMLSTVASLEPKASALISEIQALAAGVRDMRAELKGRMPPTQIPRTHAPVVQAAPPAPKPPVQPKEGAVKIGRAEQALLAVLAPRYPNGTTRPQLSILSGYSSTSSSFANALSALRTSGAMTGTADSYMITDRGYEILGPFTPMPSGDALRDFWSKKLDKAGRTLFSVITRAYPLSVSKEELSRESGYSITSSSFANALSQLRTLELITRGAEIRASEFLFS